MRSEYHNLYRVRKYFVVNNGDGIEYDPDLTPVVFTLPEPPKNWEKIKNYGLHPDDQIYRTDDIPERIKMLEERVERDEQDGYDSTKGRKAISGYGLLKSFWGKLSDEAEHFEKEIKWMRHVIWKRYYGEWVFIDGNLMWIPPRYYMYINFWHLNVENGYARPDFRIRDWKSGCVNHYLRHTAEGFGKRTKKGYAIKDENGYDIVDFGVRVFYGPIRPKNRRSGATHEGLNEAHETVCTGTGKKATVLSKSVPDVVEFFEEMLFPAWRRIPLFLKPIWIGTQADGMKVEYKAQSNLVGVDSMDSILYYVKTTDEVVLDSKRLDYILNDEQGKKTGGGRVDVSDRYGIGKQTLATGNGSNIHGFTMNPSTAEEMEDGAKQYKQMCEMSNFYQRNKTGQTKTGLMLVYFPAQYCLEGFVDCFGGAVIEKPTERQIRLTQKHYPNRSSAFIHHGMGSREFLLQRNQYLLSGKPDDLREYRRLMRKHPMKYSESWIGDSGDMGFPIVKIDSRIAEADSYDGSWVDTGHFEWTNGLGSAVVWKPGGADDKFELSYHIKPEFTNRRKKMRVFNGIKQRYEYQDGPFDPRFILGGDAFGFDNKSVAQQREDRSRKSDGGIGGYYPFDPMIDDETEPEAWTSDRCILTYRHKPPSSDAYNEDLLMAAIYLGAWIYPERNITNTWEFFIRNGYGGYLKYDVDLSTGKPKDKPGYWMGEADKKEMFSDLHDYLVRNVHREKHVSLLLECKNIKGPEDLKNFDLIAAFGAALRGARGMKALPSSERGHNPIEDGYKAIDTIFG